MHPNTFILLWTLTFHSPINSCCIIFISCPTFILIYKITKIKWLANSVSCWLWGFYFFTAYFFLHFCFLLLFSRSMFGLICAPLNRHLKAFDGAKPQTHTAAIPVPWWAIYNVILDFMSDMFVCFYFYCFWNDYRKHIDMFKQNRWKSTSLVKRESVYHKGIHICIYRGTVHIKISYTSVLCHCKYHKCLCISFLLYFAASYVQYVFLLLLFLHLYH